MDQTHDNDRDQDNERDRDNEAGPAPIRVAAVITDRFSNREVRDLRAKGIIVDRILFDPDELAEAVDEVTPDVVIVDTALDGDTGFETIERSRYRYPQISLLARTAAPADHDTVARALAAGAAGYVVTTATVGEMSSAVRTVAAGDPFLPVPETTAMLAEEGSDLGLTAAERDSRLRNLVIGLIPLAGGLTALMSLLWRRYLGQIGLRPVDLAIDPATRLVDAFFALSLLLAIVGPVLFVGSWLDLLQDRADRRTLQWLVKRRRIARLVLTLLVLAVGSVLAYFGQVILALFVGPLVAGLVLTKIFDLDDDLPAALRLSRWDPGRTTIVGVAVLVLFLAILSFESLVIGPDLRSDGAHGWLAPQVLGFRAQPMEATSVDSGEQWQVLYLGGNADLYVLVDPCDDDRVDLVSVGSTRLEVIDTVSCR